MKLIAYFMGSIGVFSVGVSILLLYKSVNTSGEYKQLYLNFSAASATTGVYLIDSYLFNAIGHEGIVTKYEIFPLAGVLVGILFIVYKFRIYVKHNFLELP